MAEMNEVNEDYNSSGLELNLGGRERGTQQEKPNEEKDGQAVVNTAEEHTEVKKHRVYKPIRENYTGIMAKLNREDEGTEVHKDEGQNDYQIDYDANLDEEHVDDNLSNQNNDQDNEAHPAEEVVENEHSNANQSPKQPNETKKGAGATLQEEQPKIIPSNNAQVSNQPSKKNASSQASQQKPSSKADPVPQFTASPPKPHKKMESGISATENSTRLNRDPNIFNTAPDLQTYQKGDPVPPPNKGFYYRHSAVPENFELEKEKKQFKIETTKSYQGKPAETKLTMACKLLGNEDQVAKQQKSKRMEDLLAQSVTQQRQEGLQSAQFVKRMHDEKRQRELSQQRRQERFRSQLDRQLNHLEQRQASASVDRSYASREKSAKVREFEMIGSVRKEANQVSNEVVRQILANKPMDYFQMRYQLEKVRPELIRRNQILEERKRRFIPIRSDEIVVYC